MKKRIENIELWVSHTLVDCIHFFVNGREFQIRYIAKSKDSWNFPIFLKRCVLSSQKLCVPILVIRHYKTDLLTLLSLPLKFPFAVSVRYRVYEPTFHFSSNIVCFHVYLAELCLQKPTYFKLGAEAKFKLEAASKPFYLYEEGGSLPYTFSLPVSFPPVLFPHYPIFPVSYIPSYHSFPPWKK